MIYKAQNEPNEYGDGHLSVTKHSSLRKAKGLLTVISALFCKFALKFYNMLVFIMKVIQRRLKKIILKNLFNMNDLYMYFVMSIHVKDYKTSTFLQLLVIYLFQNTKLSNSINNYVHILTYKCFKNIYKTMFINSSTGCVVLPPSNFSFCQVKSFTLKILKLQFFTLLL